MKVGLQHFVNFSMRNEIYLRVPPRQMVPLQMGGGGWLFTKKVTVINVPALDFHLSKAQSLRHFDA